MNTELILMAALVANTIACLWYFAYHARHIEQSGIEREERLLKIIRNLQNRITAKDITGYMALEGAEPQHAPQPPDFGRSDGDEATIEAIQRGIAPQQHNNGQ